VNTRSAWSSLGVRAKIVGVMIPALVLILGIVALSYRASREQSLKASERLMSLVVQVESRQINEYLQRQVETFESWVQEDVYGLAIEFETLEELSGKLSEMISSTPAFCLVAVTDVSGRILAYATTASEVGTSALRNRSIARPATYIAKTPIGVTLTSDDVLSEIGQDCERTFVFSCPVKNSSGDVNGLLITFSDWHAIQARINGMTRTLWENGMPGTRTAMWSTVDWTPLAYAAPENSTGELALSEELRAWLPTSGDGQVGSFSLDSGGEYVTSAHLQSEASLTEGGVTPGVNSPVLLSTFVPEDDILSKVRQVLWTSIIIGVSGMVLLAIITWFIASGISKPIGKITGIAKRMAKGDLTQRIDVERKDEVGQLADAFREIARAQREWARAAEGIAKGDLSVDVEVLSEQDVLGQGMANMKGRIEALIHDTNRLVQAADVGHLDTRADASQHDGEYGNIVRGINRMVDALVGYLETMPAPAMIVAPDFSVRYMNRAGCEAIGLPKTEILGTKCFDHFRTSDCRTENCACARAIKTSNAATSETDAHPGGKDLEISYAGFPIRDENGEIVGAFETIQDQTTIKKAARVMEKQARYQGGEVERLIVNLEKLGSGDLGVETEVAAADEDTRTLHDNFVKINRAVEATVGAIRALANDANTLAEAAQQGNLKERADAAKHQGDYRSVIDGINKTLNAVVEPINEASRVLAELAEYDLRVRVTSDYRGDHAKIKQSLNATAEALHEAMEQVAEVSEQVATASNGIASSSQQVAAGASQQASSLEETSSSLEEMSGMTKQNADNTQQARVLAEQTKGAAEQGTVSMSNMLSSMGKIRAAAEGTAQIIRDINEIAFQTNLLALNAAVEAARAGDAGRGFAVVAEEVRNLAGRAKEAAKKTEELIKESVSLAEDGESISKEVGDNLTEITGSVGKVYDIIGEIAAASQEQAKGIDQVNRAISEMDKVVQQSAANSEESSSAAQELASQAEEMAAMVGRFQLNRRRKHELSPTSSPPVEAGGERTGKQAGKSSAKSEIERKKKSGIPLTTEELVEIAGDPDFADF
jgi:methyl-accepting chemotaxis protein